MRDRFDLSGDVAVVTGASSGLGARFASVLHDAGASVVIAARRLDRLDALAADHERMLAVACDLTDDRSLEALIDRTLETFDRLDILVNNAGTHTTGPAEDDDLDDFRRVVDLNLAVPFRLSQLAARPMLQAGRGSIVNVASILGFVASSPIDQAGYCASKGAIVNLTRELAVQWASRGVRVNGIAPGWFPSELTEQMFENEDSMRWVRRNTPMRRPGADDELDGPLLLLASDAGSYITGTTILVDGGWTAR